MGDTVTGRRYTATRPRGLAPWRPHRGTARLLDDIGEVLEANAAYLPLTVRQIFYRLVGAYGYDKSDRFYKQVGEVLNRGRRAGLVSWAAVRDDSGTELAPNAFDDPDDFWRAVRRAAEEYRTPRQTGQPVTLEVWCESAGMAPQLARVADAYGVAVFSSGGFDGVALKFNAAQRAMRQGPTVILHVGDHDKSGCALVDSLADDLAAFCADMGAAGTVRVERVAVTPEQVIRYRLPTKPAAPGGPGGAMRETVQAEALEAATLADELRTAIDRHVDRGIMADNLRREGQHRAQVVGALAMLGGAE